MDGDEKKEKEDGTAANTKIPHMRSPITISDIPINVVTELKDPPKKSPNASPTRRTKSARHLVTPKINVDVSPTCRVLCSLQLWPALLLLCLVCCSQLRLAMTDQ